MGFFSFSNEFEVAVNQPKKTVYQEIISYIEGKDWYINSLTQLEKISFQTSMTLTTYPIEFNLILKSVNETSTKLFVYARAGQLDMGRSKRIIDEMLNECFGEQDFNIVDEDTSDAAPSVEETSTSGNVSTKDLYKDIKPSQAELDYERSVRSNTFIKKNIKMLIVGVIIIVGILIFAETSSYEETKQENYTTTTNSEDIEPWMVGRWSGCSNGLCMSVEISQYGSATIIYSGAGGGDVELVSLRYDREGECLYWKENGWRFTIDVDSHSKRLYQRGSSGTLYLNKKY